jgi:sugar (pentulose or hexulose) kinase
MDGPFFLGIDIGTQGARVVLLDVKGNIAGSSEESFPLSEKMLEEQSPSGWWDACCRSIIKLIGEVKPDIDLNRIKAVSVTSTSGTVIPLDRFHNPLHDAMMYSDKRAAAAGRLCREMALRFHPAGYGGFNASSGLAKMVWFSQNFPDKISQIDKWIHAADFIVGQLSDRWGITDYSNALKSGFDLHRFVWPAYLFDQLSLKKEWLPEVVPSGTAVGTLSPHVAEKFGLSGNIKVVAGITDGCASQFASGAVHPGDWNTTIGTTLVIKGVTKKEIIDPEDRLYNHRHPSGYWMPGGAGNTGADWVTKKFIDRLPEMEKIALQLMPSGFMAYPLQQQGERFPFIAAGARGFLPEGLSAAEEFTANMEGVAYIERLAYELIENLSEEKVKAVFSAGGGSKNNVWLKIRCNVLNRPIYKMKQVTGAAGAAMLAASQTYFHSIEDAVTALSQTEKELHPDKALAGAYESDYQRFKKILYSKGYIQQEVQNA